MTESKEGGASSKIDAIRAKSGVGSSSQDPDIPLDTEPFETIDITKIELDEDIYPRVQKSQKTIEVYAEAMRSGAVFPPIEVQCILDSGLERIILMDGWHRINAYQENKVREVAVCYWRSEILDKKTHLKELRVRSVKANLNHGDRLSNRDKEVMCQTMAEADTDIVIIEQEFADIFGVTRRSINNWIGAIRARQKGSRDNLILRLSFLGWTQQEIADTVGLTKARINQMLNSGNFAEIKHSIKSGKSISEVAEYNGLDIPVTWSIVLKDSDDTARFERLERALPIYDRWSFGSRDNMYGVANYKWGLITGQIIENLLYLYTHDQDIVLDPMAGGGTTNDVCIVFNRRCASFDIEPVREDIRQHDITTGPPPMKHQAHLAILEPPYYNMKQDAYQSVEEYLAFLESTIKHTVKCLCPDGHLVLIIMDQVNKDGIKVPIIGPTYTMLENAGLQYEHLVSLPLSTEQFQAYHVTRAKKDRSMLGINRQMWIFRRPA